MTHALVPLQRLVEAKSRLAGLMPSYDRRVLSEAMAQDVLTILSAHPGITDITLITDDPDGHSLAGQHGARCWREHDLSRSGLNDVLARASDRLLADGLPVLLVHADLPLLDADDISAALDCREALSGLVIGCNETGTETNLLAFDATSRPDFCFGKESCARHHAWAARAGVKVQQLHREGIAMDVDNPLDMENLLGQIPRNALTATATILRRGPGMRLKSTLSSLPALSQVMPGHSSAAARPA